MTYTDLPLVSIGVPSYNCSNYIISTLESVKNQTYSNIELIIAEDCSTDDSETKIRNWILSSGFPHVKFIKNGTNQGVVKTCNLLLNHFQGKYYSLLGADDILLPDKIEKQVALFETLNDSVALVYSDVKVIDEKGDIIQESYFERIGLREAPSGMLFHSLLQLNFIPALSVLVKTSLVKKAGGYDESLFYEDWDMWLRLSKEYSIQCLSGCTACYRIHNRSLMQSPDNVQKLNRSYIKMFKKYIGEDLTDNQIIYELIKERAVYAYYKSDPEASITLLWCLKRKFNFKILVYYLFAVAGIQLPFRS